METYADSLKRSIMMAEPRTDRLAGIIAQSRHAEEVFELVASEAMQHDDAQRFWERLAELVGEHAPKATSEPRALDAMTDEEARLFEVRWTMPFGEYTGHKIKDVPLERLCWYADQRFNDALRRYLRSPRIRAEIEREI
jgi:hypothetical protein